MEDNFDFYIAKKLASYLFGFCHEMNDIENSCPSSFKLSSLFLVDEWFSVAFSLKRRSIFFVTGSFNEGQLTPQVWCLIIEIPDLFLFIYLQF